MSSPKICKISSGMKSFIAGYKSQYNWNESYLSAGKVLVNGLLYKTCFINESYGLISFFSSKK